LRRRLERLGRLVRLLPGVDFLRHPFREIAVAGEDVRAQLQVLILQDARDQRLDRHAERLAIEQPVGLVHRLRRRRCGHLRVGGAAALAGAPVLDQAELQQHVEQDAGVHLLRQDPHRAERARLADVDLALFRRVHHHGDHRGARVRLDDGDGLEAVHARHGVIHEDHVHGLALQELDRLLAGFGEFDQEAVALEQAPQGHPCGPGVVDHQRTLLCHGDTFFQFGRLVQTPAAC
jgi:hypothetical protein